MKTGPPQMQRIFSEAGCQAAPLAKGWKLHCPELPGETLYAGISGQWLSFSYPLDCRIGHDPTWRADFYQSLLELGERRLLHLKPALDQDERLVLSAEVPVTDCFPQTASLLLTSFIRQAALYADDIRSGDPVRITSSLNSAPSIASDFDDFLFSPGGALTEYVRSVATEGWGSFREPEKDHWRLIYRGALKTYDQAWLKTSASWALFEVCVLDQGFPQILNARPDYRAPFLRYLLRLNDELYLAKFGLDELERLVLLTELPLEVMDFNLFLWSLRTLGRYLNSYIQELEILASPTLNEDIAKLIRKADWLKYPY